MTIDSVRLALPGEAASIAAIQRRGWEQTQPAIADQLLRSIDLGAMTSAWTGAIVRPPLAEYRVLVAVAGDRVVGFAAVGPSDDPDAVAGEDALVAEFVVDPQAQRAGHGSRLLNAVADTLRADRFVRASWWVGVADDALRQFVTGSGWDADGAHRELEAPDGARVKHVRLATTL
mgnify:CR=1 FL=1